MVFLGSLYDPVEKVCCLFKISCREQEQYICYKKALSSVRGFRQGRVGGRPDQWNYDLLSLQVGLARLARLALRRRERFPNRKSENSKRVNTFCKYWARSEIYLFSEVLYLHWGASATPDTDGPRQARQSGRAQPAGEGFHMVCRLCGLCGLIVMAFMMLCDCKRVNTTFIAVTNTDWRTGVFTVFLHLS